MARWGKVYEGVRRWPALSLAVDAHDAQGVVTLHELGGEGGYVRQRPLADPRQHRPALRRGYVDLRRLGRRGRRGVPGRPAPGSPRQRRGRCGCAGDSRRCRRSAWPGSRSASVPPLVSTIQTSTAGVPAAVGKRLPSGRTREHRRRACSAAMPATAARQAVSHVGTNARISRSAARYCVRRAVWYVGSGRPRCVQWRGLSVRASRLSLRG